MGSDLILNRPEPIVSAVEVVPFTKKMMPQTAVDGLAEGAHILVKDYYSSGLLVLSELRRYVNHHQPDKSYQGQRENRALYRELSNRLLLQVKDNRLMVRKAPVIGWLKILYADVDEFLIPFAQVQGLNSSWQWFKKGVSIPVLKDRVFPFYGTYFPTRFEHLEIFDEWLQHDQGSKASAIEVGVGSGVITYQLLNHGFEKVYATDSNPNAIHGMKEALVDKRIVAKVELALGDLFAGSNRRTDLIVFNPPWLPLANDREGIDQAMYYDADLFPRFFAEALKHLNPDGRLVVLFSNLAQVTHQTKTNPIAEEIEHGGRFRKEALVKSKVKAASTKTRRNQNWREAEFVELWVLKPL